MYELGNKSRQLIVFHVHYFPAPNEAKSILVDVCLKGTAFHVIAGRGAADSARFGVCRLMICS